MVKYLLTAACFFTAICSFGQTMIPVKYKEAVFNDVRVDTNLSYRANVPKNTQKRFYHFDLYQPAADSSTGRPLIIWMHGGGFKFGSKNAAGIQLWCNSFAQRGYVCAAINYRLSKKNTLTNFKLLADGCYDAVQDAEQAVTYFKQNYKKYRIDTNRIILAGNSAGGMIALQAVYSSPAELARLAGDSGAAFLPQAYNPGKIAAVINFWGSIYDINWLQNAHVPVVSVHGRFDRMVPIEHKLSPFYGSLSIHEKADSLHIPNRLKIYEGFSHELQRHFNPFWAGSATKKRWLEAGQFAADFLYETLKL